MWEKWNNINIYNPVSWIIETNLKWKTIDEDNKLISKKEIKELYDKKNKEIETESQKDKLILLQSKLEDESDPMEKEKILWLIMNIYNIDPNTETVNYWMAIIFSKMNGFDKIFYYFGKSLSFWNKFKLDILDLMDEHFTKLVNFLLKWTDYKEKWTDFEKIKKYWLWDIFWEFIENYSLKNSKNLDNKEKEILNNASLFFKK